MVLLPDAVHRSPRSSHAAQKIARISGETFANAYLGWDHPPRPVFVKRHPSEWSSPRKSRSGRCETHASCHDVSTIRLSCFLPGPVLGEKAGPALRIGVELEPGSVVDFADVRR